MRAEVRQEISAIQRFSVAGKCVLTLPVDAIEAVESQRNRVEQDRCGAMVRSSRSPDFAFLRSASFLDLRSVLDEESKSLIQDRTRLANESGSDYTDLQRHVPNCTNELLDAEISVNVVPRSSYV